MKQKLTMTKKAAGGMSVFVVTDVADEKVANILDENLSQRSRKWQNSANEL